MGDMAELSMQTGDEYDDQYDPISRFPRIPIGPGSCPKCGSDTELRNGRYGEFYGCSTFPACRGTRKYDPDLVPPVSLDIQMIVTVKVNPHDYDRCGSSCRFLQDSCGVGYWGYYCVLFQENLVSNIRCKGCLGGKR